MLRKVAFVERSVAAFERDGATLPFFLLDVCRYVRELVAERERSARAVTDEIAAMRAALLDYIGRAKARLAMLPDDEDLRLLDVLEAWASRTDMGQLVEIAREFA